MGGDAPTGLSLAELFFNLWVICWAAEMHSHPNTQGQKQNCCVKCCVVFGKLGDGLSQAPATFLQSFTQLTLTYYFLPAAQFPTSFASGHSFTSVKDSK
jgi:hypothetical protein